MTKFTGVGNSTPKRLLIKNPLALAALTGRWTLLRVVNAAGNYCRRQH
jgi:hypothetical protein